VSNPKVRIIEFGYSRVKSEGCGWFKLETIPRTVSREEPNFRDRPPKKKGEETPSPEASILGLRKSSYLVTRNFLLLCNVPFGVVTVTKPLVAPSGTLAVIYVFDTTVNFLALVLLNETAFVPLNP